MAMPPGGQSAWSHTSDTFVLSDGAGRPWALIDAGVARAQLTISLSRGGSASDSFMWLRLEVREGSALWTHVSAHEGMRPAIAWTRNTGARELFDAAIVDPSDGAAMGEARRVAPGRVCVYDREGRARIELVLPPETPSLDGPRLDLPAQAPRVHVALTGPLTNARSSMP